MTGVIGTLLAALVVVWLVHAAYSYVVKRQRLDMPNERTRIQQSATSGYQISRRLMKRYWQLTGVVVRKR